MPWTVAQTHPNAAGVACANLHRQGFEYYNPMIKERVKLKHGVAWRSAQMFSNYLFVQIVDQWRALKLTNGISQLLMLEHEKPALIQDEYIISLRAKEGKDGLIVLNKSKFNKSNAVQVKSGPFAYQVGMFDGMSSRDRVFVLLSMLGTKRRVEIAEDNLVAV